MSLSMRFQIDLLRKLNCLKLIINSAHSNHLILGRSLRSVSKTDLSVRLLKLKKSQTSKILLDR